MHVSRIMQPDEFWQHQQQIDDHVRALFPQWTVFGLADWRGTRMVDEWALADGAMRSIRFDADDVQVLVATDDNDGPAPHLLLNAPNMLAALDFTDDEAMRRHYEAAYAPSTGAVQITVSGERVLFETWTFGGNTVAGARLGSHWLAVRCTGIAAEGLMLERINDIEPYLDGRRESIRALRRGRGLDD